MKHGKYGTHGVIAGVLFRFIGAGPCRKSRECRAKNSRWVGKKCGGFATRGMGLRRIGWNQIGQADSLGPPSHEIRPNQPSRYERIRTLQSFHVRWRRSRDATGLPESTGRVSLFLARDRLGTPADCSQPRKEENSLFSASVELSGRVLVRIVFHLDSMALLLPRMETP